jgi:RNA polymerase sigma factor (sigma-70 family)
MSPPPSTQAAGLEAVFRALRPELERRARAMGAADDAEDVLQDVWIRLQTSSHGPIANPRAYLLRMVYTSVLDRRRGRLRTSAREAAWVRDAGSAVDPATGAEAERVLIARETLAAVEARLEALGDPAAMIFRRHRIDGHTQRRIAEDLRMGLSTVEKHLRRAYAALPGLEGAPA